MAVWKSVNLFLGDVIVDDVRTASDSYQFAWVDGRQNSPARRVIIDQDGVIIPTTIGLPKPTGRAVFTSAIFNSEDDKGTSIKKGKILLVCYTYKNEQGDESNPSPVTVLDTLQYQTKGAWEKDGVFYPYAVNGGTYLYSSALVGSIESFVLTIPISNTMASEVRVYVAEADYSESIIPPTAYRLTANKAIPTGAETVSVTISAVPSIVGADYENDIAPSGDDITIVDGTNFIANAVNGFGFAVKPEAIWAITLTNNNSANYVNRFHRLDLIDDSGAKPAGTTDYLVGIDWDAEDREKIRLYDTDMVTPLEVYYYPLDSLVKIHAAVTVGDETDDTIRTRMLAFIRIPIVSAHADKTIYLVRFTEPLVDFTGMFTELVLADPSPIQMTVEEFYEDIVTLNPVLDENIEVLTRHSFDTILPDSPIGGRTAEDHYASINAANSNMETFTFAEDTTEAVSGDLPMYDELAIREADPVLADVNLLKLVGSETNDATLASYLSTTMIAHKGYFCGFFKLYVKGDVQADILVQLRFNTDLADKLKIKFNEDATPEQFFSIVFDNDGETTEAPAALNLTDASVTAVNGDECFIFVSWDQVVNAAQHAGSTLKVTLAVYLQNWYASAEVTFADSYINNTKVYALDVKRTDATATAPSIFYYASYYKLRFGSYVSDNYAILNLARFMPFYEIDGIGAYDEFALNDAVAAELSFLNSNVAIDTVSLINTETPGRIQWGRYGAMPDLNEYPVNENILRIVPMKSLMPTDEHNTILIFTESGENLLNVHRLSLVGTTAQDCKAIKELIGLGALNPDSVCVTRNGVAWLSRDGLIILGGDGLNYASQGKMVFSSGSVLVYDYYNDLIWVRGTDTYVYQVKQKVWWNYTQSVYPGTFLTVPYPAVADAWFCYADGKIYQHGTVGNQDPYKTMIKTKAYAIVNKLGRIKLISSLFTGTYKYLVRLFGAWITTGTSDSAQYTAYNNIMTSAPNTKSDYAQIEMEGIDGVIGLQTEDEGGR